MSVAIGPDSFWNWLEQHCDCILRAGARGAWLYDQEDLHWHLRLERQHDEERHLVQLMRGKQIIAELVLSPELVAYVEMVPVSEDEGQTEFQLFGSDGDGEPIYVFLLAHAMEQAPPQGDATH